MVITHLPTKRPLETMFVCFLVSHDLSGHQQTNDTVSVRLWDTKACHEAQNGGRWSTSVFCIHISYPDLTWGSHEYFETGLFFCEHSDIPRLTSTRKPTPALIHIQILHLNGLLAISGFSERNKSARQDTKQLFWLMAHFHTTRQMQSKQGSVVILGTIRHTDVSPLYFSTL